MQVAINHFEVESTLRDSGSTWRASQAHGLLCSRLALMGSDGCDDWLRLILESSDGVGSAAAGTLDFLERVSSETYRQLSGRQSEFEPLLPDETEPASVITEALAEWCEGFLHGLVSNVQIEALKEKLAAEPISDIIKDMLEMTRAAAYEDEDADEDEDDDEIDEALTELVEYLRVATQLVYEELAELRHQGPSDEMNPESDTIH
jgi:uncharacterized protein YgfB (UPF0149 family)